MVDRIREKEEIFFVEGKVAIPYNYAVGKAGSKFLIQLRDNKKIMGLRCPTCNKVYVPPKSTCKDCFNLLDEWVEVSDKGTLQTYAIVRQQNDAAQPMKAPFAYGIVQLDGADTGFIHLLGEVDFKQLEIGMRVQAVFNDERVASVLDIKYFKPLA